jgi:hypothetical protein
MPAVSEESARCRRPRSRLPYIIKSLKKEGLAVRAVEDTPEVGFRVLVSGVDSLDSTRNEWDEVLVNGTD